MGTDLGAAEVMFDEFDIGEPEQEPTADLDQYEAEWFGPVPLYGVARRNLRNRQTTGPAGSHEFDHHMIHKRNDHHDHIGANVARVFLALM